MATTPSGLSTGTPGSTKAFMTSTANQSSSPKSTFKALSVSYADRIRPKTSGTPQTISTDTSAAISSSSSSPSMSVNPEQTEVVTMTTKGVLSETGATRQQSVAVGNGDTVQNGGPSSNKTSKSDIIKDTAERSMDVAGTDDEGWQAVTVKGRGSRSQIPHGDDRKLHDGGRWSKKAETSSNASTPASPHQSKDRGKSWADLTEEEIPSPGRKADNWRSSTQSREAQGAVPSGSMSLKGAEPMRDVGEPRPNQGLAVSSSQDMTSQNSNFPASGTPQSRDELVAAKKDPVTSTSIDGNWRRTTTAASKSDQLTDRISAPAPVINVWQARKEQMTTALPNSTVHPPPPPEAKATVSSSSLSSTVVPPVQPAGSTSQAVHGGSNTTASKRKANQAKAAVVSTEGTPSRRQPSYTELVSDISAWPEVQLSAAPKTSPNRSVKIRDDDESAVSNTGSGQGSGKKDKIKWIPIPASELQLSPDKPERSRKSSGFAPDVNGRIRRAANGPPERNLDPSTGKPVAKGQAPRKGGAKVGVAQGAPPKKNKSSIKAGTGEQTETTIKSGQTVNMEKSDQEGRRSSSINLPSESGETSLTVEIKPGGQALGVNDTSPSLKGGATSTLSHQESSTGHRELTNGRAHSGTGHLRVGTVTNGDNPSLAGVSSTRGGAYGGAPRGARGMRGGRGWRGGASLNSAYGLANRARASMSPPMHQPSLKSTSLPVSNNVSPRLLPTTYTQFYGDAGMGFAPAHPYQQGYYPYGPMAYSPYHQEAAMFEQIPGASFAALGPPPPMPVTMVPGLDPLRVRILGQLEYYFGDQNLPMDFFLRQQMDSNGWIDIAMVASFNRVKSLSTDLDLIKEVLQLSFIIEVREEKMRLAHGKHKSWVLPDAALSPFFEEESASGGAIATFGSSGILSSDLPAEARDRIAGDVTRDVLRAGSSAAFETRSNGILNVKDEDEASASATATDLATCEPTPATSVDGETVSRAEGVEKS